MSNVWFTADTHFGHANIIKYCARPFLNEEEKQLLADEPRGKWKVSQETIERHDNAIVQAINERVAPNDTLWILGDFCWGKFREAKAYVDRIRCQRVNLVWGNHDNRTVGEAFNKTIEQGMVKVKGKRIWLNHYPMRSWDGRFHGSWHLYGHVHGRFTEEDEARPVYLTRDVGVDACDYRPMSFEELSEYMAPREEAFEADKAAFIAGDLSKQIE